MQIKLYTEVARQSMRQGLDLAHRMWLLARRLDQEGSGWVPLNKLHAFVTKHGVRPRGVPKAIQQGLDVFFSPSGDGLRIHSLHRVCHTLETYPGTPALVPMRFFDAGLQSYRAICFAAWIDGKVISRRSQAKAWGVTTRTVQIWTRKVGLQRKPQYATLELSTANGRIVADQAFGSLPEGSWIRKEGARTLACWEIPSLYTLPGLIRAPRGAVRKVSKTLRKLLHRGEGEFVRRYWRNVRKLSRALQRGISGPCYLARGRGRWACVVA